LESHIKQHVFRQIIEFLYTGFVTDSSAGKTAGANSTISFANELLVYAEQFQCEHLVTICRNIIENQEFLNPSIGTYLNDTNGNNLINLFFNKQKYSDLTFILSDGSQFFAHKSLVSSRSKMLKSLVAENSGDAISSQNIIRLDPAVTKAAFSAFLEYVYWDHAPIQECPDSVGILALSRKYGITRLITLCELYITKQIEVATTNDITNSPIDIIGILLSAQQSNAKQLEMFCLHFISSNFQPMKKRPEWNSLKGNNIKYVEENQWPPVSYLKQLEQYEKEKGISGSGDDEKCIMM